MKSIRCILFLVFLVNSYTISAAHSIALDEIETKVVNISNSQININYSENMPKMLSRNKRSKKEMNRACVIGTNIGGVGGSALGGAALGGGAGALAGAYK